MAARKKAAPRLKVGPGAKGAVTVDYPDKAFGQIALMKALGTTDEDFLKGLVAQLVSVGSQGSTPEESGTNFMLAVVKGIEPRDQIEAMLAAQMAAVYNAAMTFARRLAHVDNLPQQDSAQTAFNKLARTFAAQVSALKDYRSKGEQKIDCSACPRRRWWTGHRRQCRRAKKTGGSTPCIGLCTWRRDVAPDRNGAGYSAARQRCGGRSVCRMHGAAGGAPKGNRNALKHGASSAETLTLRKEVHALARMARETMAAIE
jgi:hypothetical protein